MFSTIAATSAQHCALATERSVTDGEQPILGMLISIRNRLAALKKDRGNYYRPNDIVGLYNELLDQVKVLNRVRAKEQHDNDTYKNRVDSVLDECFQLFSLFYLALGKNKEIPATYVQLVTIKVRKKLPFLLIHVANDDSRTTDTHTRSAVAKL
ncbi:hypothetical protein LPJ71_000691 [Coemansia sp. S17]|nr:hypothetical protein LPJ71_000691 [Coemansia sp. S17]